MKVFLFLVLLVLFTFFQYKTSKVETAYPAVHSFGDSVMRDAGYLSLGLRRLGADISFVELLQYYGTPELETMRISAKGKHVTKEDIEMSEYSLYGIAPKVYSAIEGGNYPQILSRARYILSLDPYFKYAAVFSAGVLAFNLNRGMEAIELLEFAKKYSPYYKDYDLYIAAIGYSKAKNPEKAAQILDEAIKNPQTPAIVKNVTAFLHKKLGNYRRAYEIYLDIYQNSKDPKYVDRAEKQLTEMKKLLKPTP